MKNNIKQPFFGILFLSLIIGMPHLHGQNTIFDHSFPGRFPEKKIIRNYTPNVDIQYVVYYEGQPYGFDYIDRSSGNVLSFFMPVGYNVYDFEIHNGYVYFCGDYPAATMTNRAFYGWFNIDSVFLLNGTVYYKELPVSMLSIAQPTYNVDCIKIFHKIAVDEIDGTVHLFMTGDGTFDNNFSSVIAEAWPEVAGWKFVYTIDFSKKYQYCDVIVTNNYVVLLVQTTANDPSHIILPYPRHTPTTAHQSIFDNVSSSPNVAITNYYLTSPSIFSPGGYLPIIFNTEKDGFGTLCIDISQYPSLSYVMSIYQNPTTNPYKRFSFSDGLLNIWGTIYNPMSGSISTTLSGGFTKIFLTKHPFNNIEEITPSPVSNWHSIDWIKGTSLCIVSGKTSDFLLGRIWTFDENSSNCIERQTIDILDLSCNQQDDIIEQRYGIGAPPTHSFQPKTETTFLNVICTK